MLALQGTVRGHGEHYAQASPLIQQWLRTLKNKHGVTCCNERDNLPVEEWEPKDNSYRIKVEGDWYDVDPSAILDTPNRIGYPQAWIGQNNGQKYVRCFLPGALF